MSRLGIIAGGGGLPRKLIAACQRVNRVADEYSDEQTVMKMIDFIRAKEGRSVLQPKG